MFHHAISINMAFRDYLVQMFPAVFHLSQEMRADGQIETTFALYLLLASAMSASPAAFTIHDNTPLLFLPGRVGLSIENRIFVGQIFCIPNVLTQDVK